MTNFTDSEEPTVEELLALGEPDFIDEVTVDLTYTARADSPFQDERLRERTLDALTEHLWQTNARIQKRAEDPACTSEQFSSTLGFRKLLLYAIFQTERRIERSAHPNRRSVSLWKDELNTVADAIEGGPADHVLDEIQLPFPTGTMTLRDWLDIRRTKEPSRVPERMKAVA